MTEPRLQFPDEMPPGKMAHAALQIGNLCQECSDKGRRNLYGKLNSAFLLWEWSDVAAVLEATRPEAGQTAEAAFAATLTKAKAGRWLRRREGNPGEATAPPEAAGTAFVSSGDRGILGLLGEPSERQWKQAQARTTGRGR